MCRRLRFVHDRIPVNESIQVSLVALLRNLRKPHDEIPRTRDRSRKSDRGFRSQRWFLCFAESLLEDCLRRMGSNVRPLKLLARLACRHFPQPTVNKAAIMPSQKTECPMD